MMAARATVVFDSKNCRRQKHQVNANKYFFKTFFVNHGAKLYHVCNFLKIKKIIQPRL